VFIVPTVKIEEERKRTKKVGQMGKVGILQSRKTRKEIDVRSASLHFVQECKMKPRRGRNCFL
jgi:ribosomal protein L37AE/L43A